MDIQIDKDDIELNEGEQTGSMPLQDISNRNQLNRYKPLEEAFNKKFSLICDFFEKVSTLKTTLKIK
jgi:hypothetical protein